MHEICSEFVLRTHIHVDLSGVICCPSVCIVYEAAEGFNILAYFDICCVPRIVSECKLSEKRFKSVESVISFSEFISVSPNVEEPSMIVKIFAIFLLNMVAIRKKFQTFTI